MAILRLSRKIKPDNRDKWLKFISSGVSKAGYGFAGLKFGVSLLSLFRRGLIVASAALGAP